MVGKNDFKRLFLEMIIYFTSLLILILIYFMLIRKTLYLSFISDAIESLGFFYLILLILFPIAVYFIPLIFEKFKTKEQSSKIMKVLKISTTIIITILLANYIAQIEAFVSNQDTIVTTSNWMEPTIPVFAKDSNRGSNFKWLKVSMLMFQIGSISLELSDK